MSTLKFVNDIAGDFPIQRETVIIGSNQDLKRGAILKEQTAVTAVKAKYSFALSSLSAVNGKEATLTIGSTTYSVTITSSSTIDDVLGDFEAAAAADAQFDVEADTTNDKLILEAKTAGADSTTITLTTTATLTIGTKQEVVKGVDAVEEGFFAVSSDDDEPIGYLLEDVKTEVGVSGVGVIARTGCFADDAAIIADGLAEKTIKDKLAARCLFFRGVVAVK